MSKQKPNFNRKAVLTHWEPKLSDTFCSSIKSILNLDGVELEDYLCGIKGAIGVYRMYKLEDEKQNKHTKTTRREAASEIKKHTKKLMTCLSGDAGGIAPYLRSSLSLKGDGSKPNLDLLIKSLTEIEEGCNYYINDIYPNLCKNKGPRIKNIFARDVMTHYAKNLPSPPTTTLSTDYDVQLISKYPQVLQACFHEVDCDIPSDGDLKKLMSWALNNQPS